MPRRRYVEPFCLIVIHEDHGTFAVEGPMTDDSAWNKAVVAVQQAGRKARCCTGSNRRPPVLVSTKVTT
jgi:hypothetical protein